MGFPGGSAVQNPPAMQEPHFRYLGQEDPGRGVGHGNPGQCSCLENPMDRGACQASVLGSQRVRHD